MDITVKPLTPDLTPAYLDFFDNRAFSDNNPMGPCYCNAPIMSAEEIEKMVSEFGSDCKGTLRRYAVKQLAEGRIFGYLAFDGEVSVGWCNAGNMERYLSAVPDFAREKACGKTLSIVCFAIAPDYRGKGVASALLERIIADAVSQNFVAIEGYVDTKYAGEYWDFTGPARLYEKFGFIEATRQGERVIMRKELK